MKHENGNKLAFKDLSCFTEEGRDSDAHKGLGRGGRFYFETGVKLDGWWKG
jgi:hypothetical protein